MNINMLRDADNDAGIYAAACAADPNATNWQGCRVYVSADGGTTYTSAFTVTAEATMGTTTNVLPNFYGGNVRDERSSVIVRLANGELSSTTNAGLRAGVNMAVIGDEIVFFRDATLIALRTYRLSGLLRGRRGSEYAMGQHAAGDRVILVDPTTLLRVTQSTADIGVEKLYKAVTSGMSVASVAGRAFTNQGTGLKPYALSHVGGGRTAAGDVILKAVRRGRRSGEWRNGVDVPLGEESEAYEIDVYEDSDYASVVRTLGGLSSPLATYTAAQQASDFGSLQATVHVGWYQRSAVVGRGHESRGAV